MDIMGTLQGIPIFIGIIFILSYLFWAYCFSQDKKLTIKQSENLVSIILIFCSLFLALFLICSSVFSLLLVYTLNLELKTLIMLTQITLIFGSFIFVIIMAGKEPRIFVDKVFNGIKLLLPSTIGACGILIAIFYYLINEIVLAMFSIFGTTLLIISSIVIETKLISTILKIEKKEDTKKIEKKELVKFTIFFLTSFVIICGYLIYFYTSFSLSQETLIKKVEIPFSYSEYNSNAIMILETNYSSHIGKASKTISLNLGDIQIDDDLDYYFEIGLIKNNSKVKIGTEYNLNKESNSNNITKILVRDNNILDLFFNYSFTEFNPDKIYIIGAKKVNTSKEYKSPNYNTMIFKEIIDGASKVEFYINNSLSYNVIEEGKYLSIPADLLNGKKIENCSLENNLFLSLKNNEQCNFGINKPWNNCDRKSCQGQCGNWTITLINSEGWIKYYSRTNGDMGNLKVSFTLNCN